jgi:hypothetical protein
MKRPRPDDAEDEMTRYIEAEKSALRCIPVAAYVRDLFNLAQSIQHPLDVDEKEAFNLLASGDLHLGLLCLTK